MEIGKKTISLVNQLYFGGGAVGCYPSHYLGTFPA